MRKERSNPSRNQASYQRVLCVTALACTALILTGMCGLRGQNGGSPQTETASHRSFEQLAAGASEAASANRVSEAIRLYQSATALRPSWSEGWWNLGTLFFDSAEFNHAREAFQQFVSVEHTQPGPGFGMLGLSDFQLKDYRRSLTALERGIQVGLGNNAEFVHTVLYHDAMLNNLFGQPEIALVRLTLIANQTAAAHPEAPKDAVLSDSELLDAFGVAALHIQKLPSEVPHERAALVRLAGHAQALIALQDRVSARAELESLVSAYPGEPGVHYFYGVYLLKEDPPAAVEEFRQEIAVSPKHAPARIQLALEFLGVGDYKQGLKYAQEAVVLAPGNFVAHVACGKLWLELGNSDRAIRELTTAVRLSPGSPDAHFALSRALSIAGQSREAARQRAEFQRLKSLSDAADRQ